MFIAVEVSVWLNCAPTISEGMGWASEKGSEWFPKSAVTVCAGAETAAKIPTKQRVMSKWGRAGWVSRGVDFAQPGGKVAIVDSV